MKANSSIISSYIFKFASALHCKRFINKHDYLQLPPLEEGVYFPYFSYPEGWSEIVPENKDRKKFSAWKKTFKKIPPEAAGAHFGIKVVFTGIGNGIFGYNWKNDEIDLTDYSTW